MKNRFFTIMLVPEASKAKHWVLSQLTLRILLGLGAFFVIGSLAMIADYVMLKGQVSENASLRLENQKLLVQVQSLENNLEQVTVRLEGIHKFADKIKEFTSLNTPDKTRTLAMGPMDPEENAMTTGGGLSESGKISSGDSDDPMRQLRTSARLIAMDVRLREIAKMSKFQEQKIHDLYEIVQDNQSFLRSMPSIRPTAGWITSGFGYRVSPYTGYKKLHDGVDIATSVGTPIMAPADGVITFSGVKPGYGLVMVIDHGYGIETRYAHNSRFFIKTGDVIKRGQKVALTGNTGLSTGPHLHYEVRVNGVAIDPSKYFLD